MIALVCFNSVFYIIKLLQTSSDLIIGYESQSQLHLTSFLFAVHIDEEALYFSGKFIFRFNGESMLS